MPSPLINKEIFLTSLECMTMGWFALNKAGADAPTDADQLRMEEGKDIHNRARSIHPAAVYAGKRDKTEELVADPGTDVIFEAEFEADGLVARADWIRRMGGQWVIGEIKSSLHNDEGPSDEHIDDLAYTTMTLIRAGLPVAGAELILMNREWRLGMPDIDLFVTTQHTELVLERVVQFEQVTDGVLVGLMSKGGPPPRLGMPCRKCEHFAERCVGVDLEDPIFVIPRLRENRFIELDALGAHTIEDIPEEFPLTTTQLTVVTAIRTGEPQVDTDVIREGLDEVQWPVGYLDFETVKTAIPLFSGVAPHEQLPTQYSLHHRATPGGDLDHVEYLADHKKDCRRELAERLIDDCSPCKTVFTYSAFEKTVIRGFAKQFSDLSEAMVDLESRLFDLLPVVRNGYVHPAFRGRSGIKVVLPVVAPGLSYKGLTINNGESAIAAFARVAMGEIPDDLVEPTRRDLLEYCKLDTLAMVRLHDFMANLVER